MGCVITSEQTDGKTADRPRARGSFMVAPHWCPPTVVVRPVRASRRPVPSVGGARRCRKSDDNPVRGCSPRADDHEASHGARYYGRGMHILRRRPLHRLVVGVAVAAATVLVVTPARADHPLTRWCESPTRRSPRRSSTTGNRGPAPGTCGRIGRPDPAEEVPDHRNDVRLSDHSSSGPATTRLRTSDG